jgi:hypothetical protein
VAGHPVATTTILGELPSANQVMNWAAFPVLFPAGQDVTIEVSYLTQPTGYAPAGRFGYLLETGAGWADTIGSVDVIVRLPYAATEENLLLGSDRTNSGESYRTTPGEQFVGQEVRWHWDNLEPTSESNIYVNILLPYAWQQIQAAQAAVDARPGDVEALVALAEAYHNAITNEFPTLSNDPFAAKSEQLYAQAVALQPDSVELQTRLAELMWEHLMVQAALPPDDPLLQPILEQLGQALLLDPQYEPALALLTEIQNGSTGPVRLPNAPQTLPLSGGSGRLYPGKLFLLLGLASLGAGLLGWKKRQRLLAHSGCIVGIPGKPVG